MPSGRERLGDRGRGAGAALRERLEEGGRVETTCWPHKEWGISGGTLLVASPPAIVARWLAQGTLKAKGVLPPEKAVDAALFFKALEERGARTTTSVAEPFPA